MEVISIESMPNNTHLSPFYKLFLSDMKKDTITINDFIKIDMRVGEVKQATAVEGSKKLIELTVDLGEDYGTVTVLTGLLQFYSPEEFVGKKLGIIANLEPRPMVGKISQGMIMAIDTEEKPVPLFLDDSYKNGAIIR